MHSDLPLTKRKKQGTQTIITTRGSNASGIDTSVPVEDSPDVSTSSHRSSRTVDAVDGSHMERRPSRPGAIPVDGQDHHTEGFLTTSEDVENATEELLVSAYVVEEETIEEAQVVRDKKIQRRIGIVVLVLLVAGVVLAIVLPLTLNGNENQKDENLLASYRFVEYSNDGYFRKVARAEVRSTELFQESNITTGSWSQIACFVKPCIEGDGACIVGKFYESGCCLGSDDCPEEERCGEVCPPPPKSCFLTNPLDDACTTKDCYTCNQVDGQDVYVLQNHVAEIDCLSVGTSIRPENGQEYQWAIFCGPVVQGTDERTNRGFGEYECKAARVGAGYSDDQDGGIIAPGIPCQFISLGECGCAPDDVFTFGLPDPSGPCVPGGDCPFLCSDAGEEYAQNLCHAFPGDIEWWEQGNNFLGIDAFELNMGGVGDEYELEIYIKG